MDKGIVGERLLSLDYLINERSGDGWSQHIDQRSNTNVCKIDDLVGERS